MSACLGNIIFLDTVVKYFKGMARVNPSSSPLSGQKDSPCTPGSLKALSALQFSLVIAELASSQACNGSVTGGSCIYLLELFNQAPHYKGPSLTWVLWFLLGFHLVFAHLRIKENKHWEFPL